MDEVRNFTSKLVLFAVHRNDEFLVSISSSGQLPYWRTLLASLLGRYLPLGLFWVYVKVHQVCLYAFICSFQREYIGAITPGFMIVTSMFYTRAEQTKRVGYWCMFLFFFSAYLLT